MRGGVWVVCVVIFIFISVVPAFSEQLTVILQAEKYQIINLPDGFHKVRMEQFGNLLTPGKPMLPAKTFLIAIPPDAEVDAVTVKELERVELVGKYHIAPAPLVLPMDNGEELSLEARRVYRRNRKQTYSTDKFYPENTGWDAGQGTLRNYKFVRVTYAPFAYHPLSKKLVYFPAAEVTIHYSILPALKKNPGQNSAFLSDRIAEKKAEKSFVNFKRAKVWYLSDNKISNRASLYYNYLIITTDSLKNSLSSFVSWKISVGFSVKVVTISWIRQHYSGLDLPEKIRNFLIEKYLTWGVEYVLLVGSIDVIPMRMCYPKANSYSENTPTDYYYADLSGDWDSDGDGRYGEFRQDEVDWVPEVVVGRIPYSDAPTVWRICQKLINFESSRELWKNNALLLGAMSNYTNEDGRGYSRTDGALLMELHRNLAEDQGGNITTMYEKAGINPSPVSCTAPLTHQNVVESWSQGQYGMVNWWAHGSTSAAYRKWWATDDGDSIPESGSPNEISWGTLFSRNDCSALNDQYPSIIFTCSCNNGYPENDNLGKNLLKQGAATVVASSRLSWYSVGWSHQDHGGNASLDYYFFDYLINQDDRVGDALYNSKVFYANNFMYGSWGWVCWQNLFDFNLYGDPALYRLGLEPTSVVYDISGKVTYRSSNLPVDKAKIDLMGISPISKYADGSGDYQFTALPAGVNYEVIASKISDASPACIYSYDASLAARIALGIMKNPTPEQLIAADVDKNGTVQMYDASLIAQYVVELNSNLASRVGEWCFMPEVRTYQPLSCACTNQDFTAIILGDVDGNWLPGGLLTKASTAEKIYSGLNDMTCQSGEFITIPLTVDETQSIYSFDVILRYQPEVLKYHNVRMNESDQQFQVVVNQPEEGKLIVAGYSPEAMVKNGSYPEIVFEVVGKSGDVSKLELINYRINAEQSQVALATVKVRNTNEANLPGNYALLQNYPNPFNPTTIITYQLPVGDHVNLTIYNMLGRAIRQLIDEVKKAGYHQVQWDGRTDSGESVSSGVYLYKIEAGTFVEIKKMLIVR